MTHTIPMSLGIPTTLLALVAASATLAACGRCEDAAEPAQATIALRSYDVPEGYAPRLAEALRRSFVNQDDHAIARATVGPAGSLVVVGPASVLAGIDEMIDSLVTIEPEAPQNIELSYWIVRGVPGDTRGDGLDAVASVLDAVTEVDGDQRFELLAARRLTSLDGHQAKIDDEIFLAQIPSRLAGGHLVADIEVVLPGSARTETRLVLEPGRATVLAQAGAVDAEGVPGQVYVIVRPTAP